MTRRRRLLDACDLATRLRNYPLAACYGTAALFADDTVDEGDVFDTPFPPLAPGFWLTDKRYNARMLHAMMRAHTRGTYIRYPQLMKGLDHFVGLA